MQELFPNVHRAETTISFGPLKFPAAMFTVKTEVGLILIDPFELTDPETKVLEGLGTPTHAVITGITHERDCDAYRKRYGAKVMAHRDAVPKLEGDVDATFGDGEVLAGGLIAIGVPGTRPGETILFRKEEAGTLIAGDALMNIPPDRRGLIMRLLGFPAGLGILPKMLIADKKLAAESYQKLLDYDFNQILMSHGQPILSGAKQALQTVLGGT